MTARKIAIVVALFLAGTSVDLAAQARVGGGGVGGGGRGGGGVQSGGGGGISAAPGGLGGGSGSAGQYRGSASHAGGVRAGTALHPQGYIGASSATTNAPLPQAPPAAAAGAPQPPGQPSTPRAGVESSVSRTFVSVPRGRPSIPPLGDSIPPLESSGRRPRARIDPANIRGIGAVDLDFGRGGRGRGFGYRFPVVYLPYGYGYSDYSSHTERIVIVDHQTAIDSRASVERTPQSPASKEEPGPAGGKIIELRPRDPETEQASTGGSQDPSSVEVLSGSEAEGGEDRATVYLIALKNDTVVTSREHWIAGNSVHYITPKGEQRRVLIENVDLDLSARLNRERGLAFALEVLPEN